MWTEMFELIQCPLAIAAFSRDFVLSGLPLPVALIVISSGVRCAVERFDRFDVVDFRLVHRPMD
jgi:hypothetical protein